MKLKMSIMTRMMVSILLTAIVTFTITTNLCERKSRQLISDRSKIIVEIQSNDNAVTVSNNLQDAKSTLDSISSICANLYNEDDENRDYLVDNALKKSTQNTLLLSPKVDWYASESDIKSISEPFIDRIPNKNESAYMCKIETPIMYDGEFVGSLSANVIVDTLLRNFKNPFGNDAKMKILMITNNGTIAFSKNNAERMKKMAGVMPNYCKKYNLESYVNKDSVTIIETDGQDVAKSILCFHPIKVDEKTHWSLCVVLPKRCIVGNAQMLATSSYLLVLINIIIIGLVTFFLSKRIGGTLRKIGFVLGKISKGELNTDVEITSTSLKEIDEIAESTSTVIEGLKQASEFAEQIGHGNLKAEFDLLSKKDKLGNALINMRDNLVKTEEEAEKRKIADEKVNWATLGLAKFGEVLHTNNQSINDLSYQILHDLIKYIDVNQGAIYILDDTQDEPIYEMTAAIAYDRRKFMQKRFAIGEDLVGRCAFERKTIYMTDIPHNYINITSGMGSATATTLLLVPLVLNDSVFGIIELAAFQQLEDYKINFVEKLAESIASTISTVKINERTNNLLNQSKIQAEELSSKEEEMRQNMEELQATQEEAARRENESNAIMKVINDKLIVVEYDMDGTITNINDTYAQMLDATAEEIIGQKSNDGVDLSQEQLMSHIQMWNNLRMGKTITETNHITLNGKDLWIKETYSPVFDQNENHPYKVIKVGIDITEQVNASSTIDKLKEEQEQSNAKIAELEDQLNAGPASAPAKPKKASKPATKVEPDNEFNAEVGEQPLIEWNENCEMGIIEIDEQLKKLTELENSVYTTFRANKSKKEIKESLRSLIDFASYHFGNVEGYADESSFDGKKQLKHSFDEFLNKINEFLNLYTDGKIKSADGLMLYMNKWTESDIEQMKNLGDSLKK